MQLKTKKETQAKLKKQDFSILWVPKQVAVMVLGFHPSILSFCTLLFVFMSFFWASASLLFLIGSFIYSTLCLFISWTEFLPVHITGFNYPSFYVPVCQASISVFNSVLPVLFCFASLILSSCISFSCVSLPWCFPHPWLHCAYLSFSLSVFSVCLFVCFLSIAYASLW